MSKKSYFIKEKKKIKNKNKLRDENVHKNSLDNVFYLRSRKKRSYSQRSRKRCFFSGRPRGYINLFGFSRIISRELISNLYIPGSTKASW
ncbi:SSU ribosomal protein S14p (S29e) [Candidatus Vidania fulgoroideae]|nr:SSU ribosomal protein S14p (S29e) [Candidatus Vidania fulgoroideae]